MAAEARAVVRVTASRAVPGWLVIVGGVAVTQVIALVLFVWSAEPWQALVVPAAVGGAAVIMARPRLGLYVMTAVLVGQWPWNISRYAGLVAAVSALVWLVRSRRPLLPRSSLLGLVLLYVVIVLLSTFSPATSVSIADGAIAAVSHLALGWLCVVLVDSRRVARTVFGIMVVAGVVTAIIGLVQAVTRFRWPASTYVMAIKPGLHAFLESPIGVFRIDSITGTPDFLGVTMQTVMPFMLCWLLRQRRMTRWLLGVAGLSLLGTASLLSFARGAWIVTPIVLLMTLWMVDRRRVFPVVVALALGLVALMAWEPVRTRAMTMIDFLAEPAGPSGELEPGAWRVYVVPAAIEVMLARPWLGVGIDQSAFNWPASAAKLVGLGLPNFVPPPIHNGYLAAGVELGLGGLAVVLALITLTAARLRWVTARFEHKGDAELASWSRAAFAAFVGLALGMLFYPVSSGFRYFWLLVGLTAALVRLERAAHDPRPEAA